MAEEQQSSKSACPHPEAVGTRWGDPISEERRAALQVLADKQREWAAQPEGGRDYSPMHGVKLNGADVFWLAAYALAWPEGDMIAEQKHLLTLFGREVVAFDALHLEEADLRGAHLEGIFLLAGHLERAILFGTHLEGADLRGVHLEQAELDGVHLERAILYGTHLEGARIWGAHLERARLYNTYLAGASLHGAHLERAGLNRIHLEGIIFREVPLAGADLTHAYFDSETDLSGAYLSDQTGWPRQLLRRIRGQPTIGAASLADVRWNGADLTTVEWAGVHRLGDERTRRWWWRSRAEAETALRANIQLAKQLDDAGLKDDADRFFYRANICRRGVHLLRLHLLRWLFSWLLYVIAGYGYKPIRSVITYVLLILGFAAAYLVVAPASLHLTVGGAIVTSMVSFHGRGFFPGQPDIDGVFMRFVAAEALCGLFIEITFIATFTQRFFAR